MEQNHLYFAYRTRDKWNAARDSRKMQVNLQPNLTFKEISIINISQEPATNHYFHFHFPMQWSNIGGGICYLSISSCHQAEKRQSFSICKRLVTSCARDIATGNDASYLLVCEASKVHSTVCFINQAIHRLSNNTVYLCVHWCH